MPCHSDDGIDLADVPNTDDGLYLNAYVETPEFTKFGIPGILHYTGASSPFSLVVVGFVPVDSGFREIVIESVSVSNDADGRTTHVHASDALDELKTTHGAVLCGNVPCGRIIDRCASVTLVVKGALLSHDGDRHFERTLELPIHRSTYVYPGWAFVFLPMYA